MKIIKRLLNRNESKTIASMDLDGLQSFIKEANRKQIIADNSDILKSKPTESVTYASGYVWSINDTGRGYDYERAVIDIYELKKIQKAIK